jgi:hypothetical protein
MDATAVEVDWSGRDYGGCRRRPIRNCDLLRGRRAVWNAAAVDRGTDVAINGGGTDDVRAHWEGNGAGPGCEPESAIPVWVLYVFVMALAIANTMHWRSHGRR